MSESTVIDTIARQCVGLRVRQLNRVITAYYEDALRPLGLKVSQLNILVATAKLGLARPAQLCNLLNLETSTLSRNVERMRAKGWLETVAEADGRTQPFRLTPRGRKLIERAAPAWKQGQRRARQLLGDEGVALLDRLARTLRSSPA